MASKRLDVTFEQAVATVATTLLIGGIGVLGVWVGLEYAWRAFYVAEWGYVPMVLVEPPKPVASLQTSADLAFRSAVALFGALLAIETAWWLYYR